MNNWTHIGKLDDIPVLGARVIETDSGDIAIFRNTADKVFALRDQCPHRGGPLSQGIVHGEQVTCPLHNLRIKLTDGQAIAPDEGCTALFAVRLEADGDIYLQLPTETDDTVADTSASQRSCTEEA